MSKNVARRTVEKSSSRFAERVLWVGALAIAAIACKEEPPPAPKAPATTPAPTAPAAEEKYPAFSLAWSEYPSWSTFGVADELGLVKKKEGELGPIEKKWKVDLVLKEGTYDACISMYASAQADAAALTNMDSLNPALGRDTVAVLPTSTSFGADAVIVEKKITKVKQLKKVKVHGLKATVSEYMFARNLEILGEKEADYEFVNKDPEAAAVAMQQKQKGFAAIAVWNPFVLQTLKSRDDVHVLFDSTTIKGEIIDMLVVAKASLEKPGGAEFVHAIIDTFYAVSQRIEDPATRSATLMALSEKFAKLDLPTMEEVVKQTAFYKTPEEGIALYGGQELPKVMDRVVAFSVAHGIVEKAPSIGYGASPEAKQFVFDTRYMEAVKARGIGAP